MSDLDQMEINGRELPELARTATRGYREEGKPVRCTCRKNNGRPKGPVLARFYTGPDDDGAARAWVWVPPFKAPLRKIPATATTIPLSAGETAWQLHAQCSACDAWWIVWPGAHNFEVAPGLTVVMSRRNRSFREPWGAGDLTIAGRLTGERIRALRGTVMLARVESSTWGVVQP